MNCFKTQDSSRSELATITLKIMRSTENPMYVCNCHTPLQTGLKIPNGQHTRQFLISITKVLVFNTIKRSRLHIPENFLFLQLQFVLVINMNKVKP